MPTTPEEQSRALLEAWLQALEPSTTSVVALPGDVSLRRYFRVTYDSTERETKTAIAAYYPPQIRDAHERFRKTSRLLDQVGVRSPRILAHDHDRGLMLVEDLGSRTLFDARHRPWPVLEPFLRSAADDLLRIQSLAREEVEALNPPLDSDALRAELEKTWTVFLAPGGLLGDSAAAGRLRELMDLLCEKLGAGETRPSHRDFMARNLVPLGDRVGLYTGQTVRTAQAARVSVLDHQDLRMAPALYDLASLLNDSLYPPADVVERLCGNCDLDDYHRCAVQRTLKIVGTFASFAARGSSRYLRLIAPSLRRTLEHLACLPEGRALSSELESRWQTVL